MTSTYRCWAVIDLDALRANVRTLVELVRPSAVLAVVKADAADLAPLPIDAAAPRKKHLLYGQRLVVLQIVATASGKVWDVVEQQTEHLWHQRLQSMPVVRHRSERRCRPERFQR